MKLDFDWLLKGGQSQIWAKFYISFRMSGFVFSCSVFTVTFLIHLYNSDKNSTDWFRQQALVSTVLEIRESPD